MEKELTQKINENALNNPPKGLSLQNLLGAKGFHEIDCPECADTVNFYPAKFIWENDGNFEFCNVDCPECSKSFELVATDGDIKYEFFTA
jgi:hypothetical protein